MDKIRKILLPDLGEGIETATISEAIVSVGEKIKQDDIILVLESDKASMEIPIDRDCRINKIHVAQKDKLSPGDPILTVDSKLIIKEKKHIHIGIYR